MSFKSEHDYYAWLRLREIEDSELARKHYAKLSGKRDHIKVLDRRRRKTFGPGRFHAATSAGLFLNKKFVKGWGGVNPENP